MSKSKFISLQTYTFGFVASLILTFGSYSLAVNRTLSRRWLITALTALALTQFMVQLVCFLHLGKETKPRWKLLVFGGMILVVAILAFGSLWIMYNLNYHMNVQQMYQYLNNQGDGL